MTTAAERDQSVTEPAQCGAVDEVFGPGIGPDCTRPAGHTGHHEAVCQATGRHVSAWDDLPDASVPRNLR